MERLDFTVLKSDFLKDFDVHLQEFYKGVIGKEIGFKFESYASEIRTIMTEIMLHYKKGYHEKLAIDLRFGTRKRRCAYILRFSPLSTSTVAHHFSEFLKQNQILVENPFKIRQLNLCCLGGSPASEVVAIAKVLGPIYLSTGHPDPLALKVTIVDIEENWKTTCEYVLKCLKEDDTFIGVERLAIDFNFIQADLTKPYEEDLRCVLCEADIVSVVFFLSTINGGRYTEESFQMVKKIMEVMKKDGMLFFLDNATDVHFQQMDKAAKERKDMEIIYEPCIENLHCLTLNSVEKFLEIYHGYFDLSNCMTHGFMSYCAWRKTNKYFEIEEEDKHMVDRLKLQKDNANLTRKMQEYRKELRKLTVRRKKLRSKSLEISVKKDAKKSSQLTYGSRESDRNVFKDNGDYKEKKELENEKYEERNQKTATEVIELESKVINESNIRNYKFFGKNEDEGIKETFNENEQSHNGRDYLHFEDVAFVDDKSEEFLKGEAATATNKESKEVLMKKPKVPTIPLQKPRRLRCSEI